ncbi:MAG: hypothetical protein BV457_04765, partial [Thermoplasmata archaeon M9B1D]
MNMAAIFTIPNSNSLRFIDTAKIAEMQNYDNRFIHDLQYAKTLPYYFTQSFQKGDPLWIQYRTNYTTISAYLVDSDNNRTDLSGSISIIGSDSSGRSYYKVEIDTSLLSDDCYFIEFSGSDFGKPNFNFQSESFRIEEEVNDSVWIEWTGNDRGYDDMMIWDNLKQGIRLKG